MLAASSIINLKARWPFLYGGIMTDEEIYQMEMRVFEGLKEMGRPKSVLRNWALLRAKSSIEKPDLYNKYIDLAKRYS